MYLPTPEPCGYMNSPSLVSDLYAPWLDRFVYGRLCNTSHEIHVWYFLFTLTSKSKNQLNVGKYTIHGSYGYIYTYIYIHIYIYIDTLLIEHVGNCSLSVLSIHLFLTHISIQVSSHAFPDWWLGR